jgi:hypothetical protein
MRIVKFIFLLLILALMVISPFQFRFRLIKEEPLKGYYSQSELPSLKYFTWKRWFSSEFQEQLSVRVNDNTGLRKSMIRLSNQYDYSLYGVTHAKGFIQGKNRYLFEEDYIHEYTGDYFIGKAAIDKKLLRLKNVTDSLKAHNIPLILVFEPGKASFYPEFIPGRFHPEKRSQTNYDYFVQRSRDLGLTFMDMNSYFVKMKDTARYPLFPRYGMHWSLYGVSYAVDTLLKTIEKSTGKVMPGFRTTRLITSQTPIGTDNDIGELLNLACPLRTFGAYPSTVFSPEPAKTVSALVIADSYYINIVESYGRKIFKTQDYWYYNNKLYPYQNNNPPPYVDKSNLRDKLLKFDVVLLMVSEINLHCGFWNFADETYLAFHPGIKDPLMYGIENTIRNDRDWFRFMVKKAHLQQQPLEKVIRSDAEYTFYTNYDALPGKSYLDTIQHLAITIKNNAEWLAVVEQKARKFNIPVDTVVMMDAVYSYNQSKKKQ